MTSRWLDPVLTDISEIRNSWGWFLALGILFLLSGGFCIVADVSATYATVLVFGWFLLLGGALSLIQAFRVRSSSGFFMYLLSALLRGFTGYLLVRYPAAGAVSLTLILASLFIVGGLFRTIASATLKLPRWGWSMVSGIVSLALGVLLLVQLPASSLWFIGFAIGVDMIFEGTALVAFAAALHSLPRLEFTAKAA